MKKRSLKKLSFKKAIVSNLEGINGGLKRAAASNITANLYQCLSDATVCGKE